MSVALLQPKGGYNFCSVSKKHLDIEMGIRKIDFVR